MSAELDESREAALARGLELAHVLAELGRDPRVAEALVHGLLGLVREDLARLGVLDAVLGDRELPADGLLAQRHVVLLRAGEVVEQVAVRLGRDDAEVEAQAVARDHRRLRPALGDDLVDPRELREVVDQRDRVGGRGDDVEVPHLLLEAADAASLADLVCGRVLAEVGDDGSHGRERAAEERLLLDLLLRRGQRLEDVLLGFRAEPGERAELLASRRPSSGRRASRRRAPARSGAPSSGRGLGGA